MVTEELDRRAKAQLSSLGRKRIPHLRRSPHPALHNVQYLDLMRAFFGAILEHVQFQWSFHQANLMSSSQPFRPCSGDMASSFRRDLIYSISLVLAFFQDNPEKSILGRAKSSVPAPSTTEQIFQIWGQSGGTFGSPHASPTSPTLSRLRTPSENQVEIRRRLDEISNLMAQIEPSTEITQIQELQNRTEVLTGENMQLVGAPRPAYGVRTMSQARDMSFLCRILLCKWAGGKKGRDDGLYHFLVDKYSSKCHSYTVDSPSSLWTIDTGLPDIQRWYQHSSIWAKHSNASNSTYGSFSVTFEGISIAFTGNTPPSTDKQNFSVFIDESYAYAEYMQWFLSPMLEEGKHTITLTGMHETDVDYALVSVGNQTTVIGKDIVVDSLSDGIVWVGNWQTNTSTLLTDIAGPYIVHRPLGNSTKDSRTVGNSFSFQFTGTNVSVFGIQRNSVVGAISADFRVDEGEITTFSTTSARSGNDLANTVFFSSPILDTGVHMLVMNITVVTGDQSLKLDYITYSDQVSNNYGSSSPSSSSASASGSNRPSGSSTSDSTPKATNSNRIVEDNPDQSDLHQTVPAPSKKEQKSQTWRQRGGISAEGSTSTAGSSPTSPTLSRPRSASENQAEIRRRLDEISSLMAQIEQPSTEITHMQGLQNRIEMLTEENSRLMEVLPPAYAI
ncbi:hypothetical protein F5146DRAFT_1122553 [Armillaria mellea]|nr:hypothetical protein F5146DRAFT_1122553 [Armillaria mellea]